ncbi:MAG TPA: phenylalanine--tRNA ligase subunit alpha [Oligoflexia bacterium]|nr:phenylalanine--tRNA ligase subunit alpha [Oligoflexia bacterium]HMP47677.1 phenylalanine--tRNA ligase subunit alpha [Oligoflexia bacterium]
MLSSVKSILADATTAILESSSSSQIEEIKVHFLGKKGVLTGILKGLSNLSAEERRELGEAVNIAKNSINDQLTKRLEEVARLEEEVALKSEAIDVTLPVKMPVMTDTCGAIHPLSQVQKELEDIFISLGFDVVDGPEVESEFYNFEALNVPGWHPARDMQDTIWTTLPGLLLRTQTSPIQVRSLKERKAPIRIVAPGRVFRYERVDATHGHTFYQMEGMMIDREVSVGHLVYFMKTLLRKIFGFEPRIRLRPGYFPFVEPGFELDIWFQERWMELLPCGLVHPQVLRYGGVDPDEWQGFAFGLGLSRLVMSRFQIDDIRYLLGSDFRFLNQF